ncbi:MAG TPA: TIGR01777 family oxidoreductase [Solirubrobacteraceae bacterium]|jgi:hypothetical protein|nr:TIGR01777 family oxidoreductase [Solirubrobacteraceae bacterium]
MSNSGVTVTGATGLIGSKLVSALQARGVAVTVLTRDPDRARERLGDVEAVRWNLIEEAAPATALEGRDAVIHLAGENVAQRWNDSSRHAIRDSRVVGTRNLLTGLGQCKPPPRALISASAIGYYGAHGEEPLDEDAPPGRGFLAEICVEWETEAARASAVGMRVAQIRTGVVLDSNGGALEKMLPPFKLGIGGPVAGGRQYISWVHTDDVVGLYMAALEDERWSGPVNATAPQPVNNRDFSRALGRALHRPALLPVPGVALQLLYGEMSEIVTKGQRVVPAKALVLGYEFRHPQLDEALTSALGG